MKGSLFLYSDQIIPENRKLDDRLISCLKNSRPKIAYIASAPDPQRLYFSERQRYYQLIGAELVAYYDENSNFAEKAGWNWSHYDAVHLSGGNTFHFLDWIRRTGIVSSLKRYANDGGVLIGTSAGALLLSPSIDTAILCGDVNLANIENTQALALVEFYLWPHFNDRSNKDRVDHLGLPIGSNVLCVPDGAGVALVANEIESYGDVTTYITKAIN